MNRKQFQTEISVGQLLDSCNVQRLIGDDQIYASFRNIRPPGVELRNVLIAREIDNVNC